MGRGGGREKERERGVVAGTVTRVVAGAVTHAGAVTRAAETERERKMERERGAVTGKVPHATVVAPAVTHTAVLSAMECNSSRKCVISRCSWRKCLQTKKENARGQKITLEGKTKGNSHC